MRSSAIVSQQFEKDEGIQWWRNLPFNLRNVKITEGFRPIGFRFSEYIFNIEAEINEKKLIVCGEGNAPEVAMTKAIGELIERAALVNYPSTSKNRTSNGWAAHEDIASCKSAAILELVERDAVLVHWYMAKPLLKLDLNTLPQILYRWMIDELSFSEFPQLQILISTEGIGPSVTCIFMNEKGLGVSGHSTKSTLLESIASAIAETCRAAHLAIRNEFWNDSLNLQSSKAIKIDPGTHSVYYAYHEAFPNWLFGDLVNWQSAEQMWEERLSVLPESAFKFEIVLTEPCVVGFAKHSNLLEVEWGSSNIGEIQKKLSNRFLLNEISIESINLKPHIVS